MTPKSKIDFRTIFPAEADCAAKRRACDVFAPPRHFCSYAIRFPGLVGEIAANNQESGLIEDCVVQIDVETICACFGTITGEYIALTDTQSTYVALGCGQNI
jgi:hypothetical protein